MRTLLKIASLLFVLMTMGCATHKYHDYRYFKSVGLTHDISNLENAGMVSAEDCSWKLLGYNIQADPSFEDAYQNAVGLTEQGFTESMAEGFSSKSRLTQTKVRMLTNIRLRNEGWNALIIGKQCLKLNAIAYR